MRLKKNKIYDVAINDYEGSMKENGKDIKSYQVWKDLIKRCYDPKYHEKFPTYKHCEVCDEWLYFSNFKKWFDDNYRWDLRNQGIRMELDKDLLSDDVKIYSPSSCVFLPNNVNTFIVKKNSNNTSGYRGVTWSKQKKKWVAGIIDFNTKKRKNLGLFEDIVEASNAYALARQQEVEKVKAYMKSLGYSDDIIDRIE